MTKLLVSVRSAEEAADAISAGADFDRRQGTERRFARRGDAQSGRGGHESRGWTSAHEPFALGELTRASPSGNRSPSDCRRDRLPQFVKFGLAGCSTRPGMPRRWKAALATLPESVAPVAVLYADWSVAGSPTRNLVLRYAQRLHCRALLIDHVRQAWPGVARPVVGCRAGSVRRGGTKRGPVWWCLAAR